MHSVVVALGILVAIAGTAVVLLVPFVAPWRIRLRWLVACQAMDGGFGLPWCSGVVMREVRVSDVSVTGARLDVTLVRTDGPTAPMRLSAPGGPPATLAKLEGWQAVREHLLLVSDEHGERQLDGPDATISGLTVRGFADAAR